MNPLKTITFPYFTQEQVKEINKEIRKNISEKEPLGLRATATKMGKFFHIPCSSLLEILHPWLKHCLLYTSPSPRDRQKSRMPSSA